MTNIEVELAILQRAVLDLLREADDQLSAGVWRLSPELVSALGQLKAALRARGDHA